MNRNDGEKPLNRRDSGRIGPGSNSKRPDSSQRKTFLSPLNSQFSTDSRTASPDGLSSPSFDNSPSMNSRIKVGVPVIVQEKRGVVKFVGTTHFSPATWVGVELKDPLGKNDGSVEGKRYFEAKPNHGLFIRPSQLKIEISPETPISSSSYGIPPKKLRVSSVASENSALNTKLDSKKTSIIADSSLPLVSKSPTPSIGSRNSSSSRLSSSHSVIPRKSLTKNNESSNRLSINNTPIPRQPVTPVANMIRPQSHIETSSSLSRSQSHSSVEVTESKTDINDLNEKEDSENNDAQVDTPSQSNILSRPALSMDESIMYENTPILNKETQYVPMVQYEEIKAKLKFLEQKRVDERNLISEAEEIKSHYNQTKRSQEKLISKIKSLTSENQQLSVDSKKFQERLEALELTLEEERGTLEIVAIEKEMAEEQAEGFKQESYIFKEQLEELKVRLKLYEGTEAIDSNDSSSLDSAQIRAKNIRLSEALILLRDEKELEIEDLKDKIKELEKSSISNKQAALSFEKQTVEIQQLQNAIIELKQRLEDSEDSEELIIELGERNSRLSEKIMDLESQVEHWQSMYEVSEEMYEGHTEEVKQLNSEIYKLEWQVRQRDDTISSQNATIEENLAIIGKFREAVTQLQKEKNNATEREQEIQQKFESTGEATKNLEKLAYKAGRAMQVVTSREIELELKKMELSQALYKIDILLTYVPENVIKENLDSISLLIILKKIEFEADLMCKQLEQPQSESDTVNFEFYSTAVSRRLLAITARKSGILSQILETNSESEFSKFGYLLQDASAAHKRLNEVVNLALKNEMQFSLTLQIAQVTFDLVSKIYERVILTNHDNILLSNLLYATSEIGYCADEILCFLLYLYQKCDPDLFDAVNVTEGVKSLKIELVRLQISLQKIAKSNMTFVPDIELDFLSAVDQIRTVMSFCNFIKVNLAESFEIEDPENNQFKIPNEVFVNLMELANSKFFNNDSKLENHLFDSFLACIDSIKNKSLETSQISNEKKNLILSNTYLTPWNAREQRILNEIKEEQISTTKLENMKNELIEKSKVIKQRENKLEEMKAHTAILENRCAHLKESKELSDKYKKELEKSQFTVEELQKLVKNLHSEIDSIKEESRQLSKTLSSVEKQIPKSALINGDNKSAVLTSDQTIQSHSFTGNEMGENYVYDAATTTGMEKSLLRQLNTFKNSLRLERLEKLHLKSMSNSSKYYNISSASFRTDYSSLFSMSSSKIAANKNKRDYNQLVGQDINEARKISKDALLIAAAPKLVSVIRTAKKNSSSVGKSSNLMNPNNIHWESLGIEQAMAKKIMDISLKLH
ncbi:Dynactin subunit 1 [Smittium mucronatum]|uniref:Dynactin subunit 1 n=1 Tax=Smittium mucronatum TaxID=133383 RepID=A0A1R0GMK9_9FUNG|nr:Dynactin subunit 1 [Smittium mucronatum]